MLMIDMACCERALVTDSWVHVVTSRDVISCPVSWERSNIYRSTSQVLFLKNSPQN